MTGRGVQHDGLHDLIGRDAQGQRLVDGGVGVLVRDDLVGHAQLRQPVSYDGHRHHLFDTR